MGNVPEREIITLNENEVNKFLTEKIHYGEPLILISWALGCCIMNRYPIELMCIKIKGKVAASQS